MENETVSYQSCDECRTALPLRAAKLSFLIQSGIQMRLFRTGKWSRSCLNNGYMATRPPTMFSSTYISFLLHHRLHSSAAVPPIFLRTLALLIAFRRLRRCYVHHFYETPYVVRFFRSVCQCNCGKAFQRMVKG